jgi:hypothetical protein
VGAVTTTGPGNKTLVAPVSFEVELFEIEVFYLEMWCTCARPFGSWRC